MTEDARRKADEAAARLEEQGQGTHAGLIRDALRQTGDAFLLAIRGACQTALTAVEAIDPTTETLLEEVRLEVDKHLLPAHDRPKT